MALEETFRKIEVLPAEAQAMVIDFVDMLRAHQGGLPFSERRIFTTEVEPDLYLRSLFGSESANSSSDNQSIDDDLARDHLGEIA
jgi:hypothetical protein